MTDVKISNFDNSRIQWSNYCIIYEGPENMASDSEPRKFFSRPPQKSHFGKQKACKASNE